VFNGFQCVKSGRTCTWFSENPPRYPDRAEKEDVSGETRMYGN